MKLPNGYGSITKMHGKRRNPFRVRITVGWELKEERAVQKFKTVGYYKTKQEALDALAEYNKSPYDLDTRAMTFEDVYRVWSENYFSTLKSLSSERTIKSAYNYSSGLYKMKMRDIRTYHLKECMDKGFVIPTVGKDKGKKRYATANTKSRMKSMYNLMFDYALEHEIVDKNYARIFNLDEDIIAQKAKDKKPTIPFNNDELKLMWDNVDKIPFVDMILIGIYSGWRPQEMTILKLKDIDLDKNIMFGGMKTDAGKNRFVPIHPLIRNLIVKRYEEAVELGSDVLFNDPDGQRGTTMTYDKYRSRFDKVMERLKMKSHRPHETRHSFITLAKDYRVDEYILKIIVGHKTADITERVYTHRTLEQLQVEMLKIGQYRQSDEDYIIEW